MQTSKLMILSCFALGSLSCFPIHSSAQRPVPTDAILFVDSETSTPLSEVLVIPRYSSFAGISTGAGHGPGAGGDRCYLADPFVYHRGDPFSPRQPKSSGLVWGPGWAFTGKGISIDGVTVIARGYRARWVYDLWDPSFRAKPVTLTRLAETEVERTLQQMLTLLRKPKLVDDETDLFGYCGGKIETKFHEDEAKMLEDFLLRAKSWFHGRHSRNAA